MTVAVNPPMMTMEGDHVIVLSEENHNLHINGGGLFINGQSLYQIILDVIELVQDQNNAALWLTSEDKGKRDFAASIVKKLQEKHGKALRTD